MGNKIKEVREKIGMSQHELSKRSSVSRATISGLESGRITVTTTDTLKKISVALGKTINEIFFTQ